MDYKVITVWTGEDVSFQGVRLALALPQLVRRLRIPARCMVSRGVAGCYESGEVATEGIEVLSYDVPVKIEVVLPAAEAEAALRAIDEIVSDGVILVRDEKAHSHSAARRMIQRHLLARDLMTSSPVSVRLDTSAREAVEILLRSSFKGLPVVDNAGRPIGIITPNDLAARAGISLRLGIWNGVKADPAESLPASLDRLRADGVMSSPALVLAESDSMEKAVSLMLEKGLKRLPVVDHSGALSGMLSRVDILRSIARDAPDWESMAWKGVRAPAGVRAGDILRADAPVVSPDASLMAVAAKIDATGEQRIAVVGQDGTLLGMIFDSALLAVLFDSHPSARRLLPHPFSFKKFFHSLGHIGHASMKAARDLMETGIVSVREDATVEEAVRIMAEKGFKRLPVVGGDGRYRGMISRSCLLQAGLARQVPFQPKTP